MSPDPVGDTLGKDDEHYSPEPFFGSSGTRCPMELVAKGWREEVALASLGGEVLIKVATLIFLP